MSQLPRCPACGLTLPENRLSGLCPACTWRGLFEFEAAESVSREGAFMNIPGYEIIQEIARGGMGIVYRARQKDPGRSVALKMLLPRQMGSAHMAERFRLEVRALTELEHPAILPVYQVGEHQGLPFFTMKLATGGTLGERQGQFAGDWRGIAGLMVRLAEAVQFAHEHGVLHRDLKPGNILFDDQSRAYVSDFGLAKLADTEEELTRSADFLGTPRYVAPEIAERSARHATTASDVYGLGAIFYELITGRAPFEAEAVPALLKKIAEEEPERPRRVLASKNIREWNAGTTSARSQGPREIVPRDLEVICLKCLAKEPSGRYASAGELAKDLQRWLEGKPILARPVSALERSSKWVRRNPVLGGLTAALLLCLLGGGLALWQSYRQVSRALASTQKAQTEAQSNLRDALLSQAKALGAAHGMGQRWQALEVLSQAARIRPSIELRNEAAAALARPDLRELSRFPANFGPGGSCVVFTSDLEKYITPETNGGFGLHRSADQRLLAGFPGKPALWFWLSPDNRKVTALFSDYALEIWDLEKQQRLSRWQGNIQQPPVAEFSPQDDLVAGFVPGQGLFLSQLDGTERQTLSSSNARAIFMRFDAKGERLAVVREPAGIELWRCRPKPELLWSRPMRRAVPWLAWSPDNTRLMVAGDDERGLRILSVADGQTELVYTRHLRYPRQFEFDPSGRLVASVGDDWVLRLWDARTGQDLATGVGRHRVLRFSEDSRRLTTAPTDHDLAILELAPDLVFREFRSTHAGFIPGGMTSSPDRRLVALYYPLRLYDTQNGTELPLSNQTESAPASSAFFAVDGSALFYTVRGKGLYRCELNPVGSSGSTNAPVSCGRTELVADDPRIISGQLLKDGKSWLRFGDDFLALWPEGNPNQARKLPVRGNPPRVVASADGKWAAGVDPGHHRIIVLDIGTAQVRTNLSALGPERLWFSPDSRWLVASTETGYCTWSTDTWQSGARWEAHLDSGDTGLVSFSADSSLLAARQERETFRLFSFPDCRELVTLKPPLVLVVHTSCLSADGSRLWLSAEGYRVFEWNLAELRKQLGGLGLDWEH